MRTGKHSIDMAGVSDFEIGMTHLQWRPRNGVQFDLEKTDFQYFHRKHSTWSRPRKLVSMATFKGGSAYLSFSVEILEVRLFKIKLHTIICSRAHTVARRRDCLAIGRRQSVVHFSKVTLIAKKTASSA